MNHPLAQRQSAFDAMLTQIISRFAVGIDSELDADIRTCLQEIAEFSGVDYAHTVRTSTDQSSWSVTHEWHSPRACSHFASHQQVPMGTWDWMERILLSGEVFRINRLEDLSEDLDYLRELLHGVGFKSTLQVPMRGPGGQVCGCIALSAIVNEVSWHESDVARLQLVGDVIANTMERARLTKEFQKSEMRFRTTFEQAPVGILNVTVGGKLVRANKRFCEMLGYSQDEILGQHFSAFTCSDDLDATTSLYEQLLADRHTINSLEKRYRRKDGGHVWANLSLSMLSESAIDPESVIAVLEDITDRKQAEEQQLRRALVVAASLDGVWEWEIATNKVQYSDRFAELLGYSSGDLPQTLDFFRSIFHPEDSDLLRNAIDRHVTEGTPYDVECRLRNRSGEYRWYRTRGKAHLDHQGRALRIAGSLQEIHSQKTAEAELRGALEEVKQLSERIRAENVYLQEEITHSLGFDEIVGESAPLRNIFTQVEQVAATNSSVLLLGETGTGKELLARAIHDRSPRGEHAMVKVNLAALPSSLIESELFGHVKGSFTGAISNKIGRFQLADGGTLFLDEIGELDPDLQTKLLRVLQEGEFERIGSGEPLRADVRIVAATNRDLRRAMEQGKFRSDLYYRLAVFPIEVPPLRVRRDDIPLLTWHFITKKQGRLGKNIRTIPQEVMRALTEYSWPGNVRELENVIERAMILSTTDSLNLSESLKTVPSPTASSPETAHGHFSRSRILTALEDSHWKVKGVGNAADRLGLKPSTLRYRMKALGIERPNEQA